MKEQFYNDEDHDQNFEESGDNWQWKEFISSGFPRKFLFSKSRFKTVQKSDQHCWIHESERKKAVPASFQSSKIKYITIESFKPQATLSLQKYIIINE